MRLLVLGGTRFLGPAVVKAALARDIDVTLFNRGRTNPGLFPGVPTIQGDRNTDIARLDGRAWDAVVDTCGYLPWQLRLSARQLATSVAQYLFVSTVSVYADESAVGLTELDEVARLPDDLSGRLDELTLDDVTGDTYGPLKALCETALEREMPGRSTVVRPGLIVGPRDPTSRFKYWPWRLARGGDVLAPRPADGPQQFIDVRDLGEWIVTLCEDGHVGTYNGVGPAAPIPMEELLYAAKSATSTPSTLTWVDEEFLTGRELGMWSIPLWVPAADRRADGFNRVSNRRAVEQGLRFRPLHDTVRATLDDLERTGERHAWEFGETMLAKEAELLAAWRARRADAPSPPAGPEDG